MMNIGFPAFCIGMGIYRHKPNSRNYTETSQWKLVKRGPLNAGIPPLEVEHDASLCLTQCPKCTANVGVPMPSKSELQPCTCSTQRTWTAHPQHKIILLHTVEWHFCTQVLPQKTFPTQVTSGSAEILLVSKPVRERFRGPFLSRYS